MALAGGTAVTKKIFRYENISQIFYLKKRLKSPCHLGQKVRIIQLFGATMKPQPTQNMHLTSLALQGLNVQSCLCFECFYETASKNNFKD